MPFRRLALLAAVCLLAPSCGGSSGGELSGPALDQFFAPPSGPSTTIGVGLGEETGQTFTAGVTGTLSFVEVYVEQALAGSALVLDVRPTSGGIPVESDLLALATVTIPDGTIGAPAGFFTFDLQAQDVEVTAGDVLAITLRAVGGSGLYRWGADGLPGYDAGAAWSRTPPGFWTETTGADFLFRTYVTPPAP